MISWFKKHFIPHEKNEHRPNILRGNSARNIVAIVIFLEIFTFLVPVLTHLNVVGNMAAVLPGVLTMLTNEERQAQNLGTLKTNALLNEAAKMKAEDMATKGYFAHTSPEGKTPWYWIEKVGYKYQHAGENLAVNFSDSKDVTVAWMNSPTHKENIVKKNYTEIGTGVATGIYKGKESIFVAQVYANPLQVLKELPTKKEENKNTTNEIGNMEDSQVDTEVLGAEIATNDGNDIANNSQTSLLAKNDPNLWQKLIASPRNTMNMILYIAFVLVAVSLLLYLFFVIKKYHLDLITNGLIVLAIIGAIFLANHYLSNRNMVISQSMDYSYEHQ